MRSVRGSERCRSDGSRRRNFSSSARNAASACARPLLPARGRGPRNTARSSAATAFASAPSRCNGCLSKASSGTGSSSPSAASAASRAKTPAGVSASASPPESSAAMFQRASAACTRRPSARSGVTSVDGLSLLDRFAQRDRDGERLFLGVGGFDARQAFERGVGMAAKVGIGACARATGRSRPTDAAPRTAAARGRMLRQALRRRRVRFRSASAAPAWRIADVPARARRHRACPRRRSAATNPRRDRCRARAAPRRRAAGARWSRSTPRSRGSSRSSRRRSPGRRSCARAARPRP